MYLNLVIPLSYGDDGCHLVVTEVERLPEEGIFDVIAAYTIEGYDFLDVYNHHYAEIQAAISKWWDTE